MSKTYNEILDGLIDKISSSEEANHEVVCISLTLDDYMDLKYTDMANTGTFKAIDSYGNKESVLGYPIVLGATTTTMIGLNSVHKTPIRRV